MSPAKTKPTPRKRTPRPLGRLGDAIRRLTYQKGLYLLDVARLAGTSPSGMTRIMSAVDAGHVTLATLQRIADALGARLEVSLVDKGQRSAAKATARPAAAPAARRRPRSGR